MGFFLKLLLTMFQKVVVVDCKDHLLGRLAAKIAKELLNGQHVICVRCEDINISGTLIRNKFKYLAFLRKRCNVNPESGGPFHFRAPSKILWRTIRGMIPHKTTRGEKALSRLKVFEGVPPPYDKMKKVIVPDAYRITRLRPGRRYCVLGDLSKLVGWKHAHVVQKLENKRKVKAVSFYRRKKALNHVRTLAVKNAQQKLSTLNPLLASYGY